MNGNRESYQHFYSVTSPHSEHSKYLRTSVGSSPSPKRYISFVNAASEVMSCPETTPVAASRSPDTYLLVWTPPLTHCVTLTITIPR